MSEEQKQVTVVEDQKTKKASISPEESSPPEIPPPVEGVNKLDEEKRKELLKGLEVDDELLKILRDEMLGKNRENYSLKDDITQTRAEIADIIGNRNFRDLGDREKARMAEIVKKGDVYKGRAVILAAGFTSESSEQFPEIDGDNVLLNELKEALTPSGEMDPLEQMVQLNEYLLNNKDVLDKIAGTIIAFQLEGLEESNVNKDLIVDGIEHFKHVVNLAEDAPNYIPLDVLFASWHDFGKYLGKGDVGLAPHETVGAIRGIPAMARTLNFFDLSKYSQGACIEGAKAVLAHGKGEFPEWVMVEDQIDVEEGLQLIFNYDVYMRAPGPGALLHLKDLMKQKNITEQDLYAIHQQKVDGHRINTQSDLEKSQWKPQSDANPEDVYKIYLATRAINGLREADMSSGKEIESSKRYNDENTASEKRKPNGLTTFYGKDNWGEYVTKSFSTTPVLYEALCPQGMGICHQENKEKGSIEKAGLLFLIADELADINPKNYQELQDKYAQLGEPGINIFKLATQMADRFKDGKGVHQTLARVDENSDMAQVIEGELWKTRLAYNELYSELIDEVVKVEDFPDAIKKQVVDKFSTLMQEHGRNLIDREKRVGLRPEDDTLDLPRIATSFPEELYIGTHSTKIDWYLLKLGLVLGK